VCVSDGVSVSKDLDGKEEDLTERERSEERG